MSITDKVKKKIQKHLLKTSCRCINLLSFIELVKYKTPKEYEKHCTFETYTGKRVPNNFMRIRKEHISFTDIVHSLSRTSRYGGHLEHFYSTAQHSVLMSKLVKPEYALEALLHDVTEVYFHDINKPIKNLNPLFDEIERVIWQKAIIPYFFRFGGFKLPSTLSKEVKYWDWVMIKIEKRDLIDPFRGETGTEWVLPDHDISDIPNILPWSPERSRTEFELRFWTLLLQRGKNNNITFKDLKTMEGRIEELEEELKKVRLQDVNKRIGFLQSQSSYLA